MERQTILVDISVLIDYFRKKMKDKTLLYKLSLEYNLAASTITDPNTETERVDGEE